MITIDCMDAAKSQFPRERTRNKDLDPLPKLKTHTVGVLCHGFPIPALSIVHNLTHYDNNANLIISVLNLTLQRQAEKMAKIKEEKEQEEEITENMSADQRDKYIKERQLREKYCVW